MSAESTIAVSSAFTSAAAAASQAYGQYQAIRAQRAAYQFEALRREQDAAILQAQADALLSQASFSVRLAKAQEKIALANIELEAQARELEAAGLKAEADAIREQAAFEEEKFRRASARQIARLFALGAASGVDPSSGSPLLLTMDMLRESEVEAREIRRRGGIATEQTLFKSRLALFGADRARAQSASIKLETGVKEFDANLTRFNASLTRSRAGGLLEESAFLRGRSRALGATLPGVYFSGAAGISSALFKGYQDYTKLKTGYYEGWT